MKKLLFLLLLLPGIAKAQRDFDYALYTRHARLPFMAGQDSAGAELSLERRIVKKGSRLLIVNLNNTGNTEEYILNFVGYSLSDWQPGVKEFNVNNPRTSWSIENSPLQYQTKDEKYVICIWPMIPYVEIRQFKIGVLLESYY